MSKELLKKEQQETGLEFVTMDSELLDIMSEDAKEYTDNTPVEDLMIPRISILQSGSKQVRKADPKRIEGADEGDFLDSVSNEIIKGDKGFYFVPVKRRIVYLEWKDIAKGGGLINNFGEDSSAYDAIIPDTDKRHMSGTDTEIVKTYEVYGYHVDIATKKYKQVILSFAKSQVKKMKKWNTMIRTMVDKTGRQLPEYSAIYKLTTVPESNDKGSWYSFEIALAGYTLAIPEIGKTIYERAKDFANLIQESKVQAHYEKEEPETTDETPQPQCDLI